MTRNAGPSAAGVNLGLIITPMLDMSFQILAFFIMTYHPSAIEGHIPGSLAVREVSHGPGNDAPPHVVEQVLLDDTADIVTVVIEASAGQPGKWYVKHKTDPVPRQIADEHTGWHAARHELTRELRRLRQDADGAPRIRIEPAGGLRQEFVMAVYDICRQSGYTKIDFVPPPLNRLAGQ